MMCCLCHRPLDDAHEPTVATTDGGRVHIVCADHDARAASHARTIRAVVSGGVGIGIWGLGIEGGGPWAADWMLRAAMVVVLIAAHVLSNRRWWRYQVQSVRLRWRIRR